MKVNLYAHVETQNLVIISPDASMEYINSWLIFGANSERLK